MIHVSRRALQSHLDHGDHVATTRPGTTQMTCDHPDDPGGGGGTTGGSEPPPPAAGCDAIVWRASRTGNGDVFVSRSDGTNVRQVTNTAAYESYPNLSPDCSKVSFTSSATGGIRTINLDGTGEREVAVAAGHKFRHPTWSADSRSIAFRCDDLGGKPSLCIVGADGSGRRLVSSTIMGSEPDWSPDGTKLVYSDWSVGGGSSNIAVVNVDGTGHRVLTDEAGRGGAPRWSSDGTKIVFQSTRSGGDASIHVINADGTGLRAVAPSLPGERPDFSPDDSQISFRRFVDGRTDIYVINADGTGIRNLTNHATNDFEAHWR